MDLKTMTQEELETLRIDILNEQERRARLEQAPMQIAEISRRFCEDGGDPALLTEAIAPVE